MSQIYKLGTYPISNFLDFLILLKERIIFKGVLMYLSVNLLYKIMTFRAERDLSEYEV